MRSRLGHIALCALLLACWKPVAAQGTWNEALQRPVSCPVLHADEEPPSHSQAISINNVTFSGFIQMPVSDQDEIASSVKREAHGYSLENVVDEALERVRAGWQNRGYFNVAVNGDGKVLKKDGTNVHIALFVHVDENIQYRLGKITFKNNRAVTNSTALRNLFRIQDGDIFSREKIGEGLANMGKAYSQLGYLNYTGVPSTTFDDEQKLIHLEIDVDEGRQFYVGDIIVEGLNETARQKVLKDLLLKSGQIYDSRLWEISLSRFTSLFPDCACRSSQPLVLDEKRGTVVMTLDFRPCSAD
jgi:outer membrane protein assembly factor BamA